MMKKLFWLPAILGIAGLLMSANSAFAGPSGHSGGHSGGGHYSGGHVGGGHGGGYYGGGYHHGGYYGGGYYGGGGFYAPGIFGAYDPWYDNYAYPRYSYYDSAPATQYYAPTIPYAQPAPVVNSFANVRVILPDPQARVWFDGTATTSTGAERLFHTPALTMGSTYNYQIRASWMQDGREMTQNRTVSVAPGQSAMVDFSR